jgi:predicted ATPase/class 3 adenylate cyclase
LDTATSTPTGTVTFLLTDIEGSTHLWEQHPEAMAAALARHDALAAALIQTHGGTLVKHRGEGDSLFAVFARVGDAVAAAAELQRALGAEAWPNTIPLRVRIALHTGDALLRDGDYFGPAVNRCARLRAAAHGGQVLLSAATQELVREQLPEGVHLRDLGECRLRDLTRPEQVFQLLAPYLPGDFPSLRTLDARPNNLPLQPTPLLGRERETAAVQGLLRRLDLRLVTLTGPGGTGKTRLGLQVAANLLDDFPDGVFFVDLAPIRDPDLVLSTIAQVLGVQESGGQPLLEALKAYLREKQILLLLDNFEQVIAAAPTVGELLSTCRGLKVLVTSREALRLRGEQEFPVPPLPVPDPKHLPPVEALCDYASVALFVQRAASARPDFGLTPENAAAVAEICQRLDGLPLAIELAAARVKLFGAEALLARLGSRLKVLTGGARDLPARQQTLRNTITWSYDLLEANEQRLFRRLSVFGGGWTVDAVEAVCNAEGDLGLDVLDGIVSLAERSLLQQLGEDAEGEPRFAMLETLREFGLECLESSGEAQAIRQRHANFFLVTGDSLRAAAVSYVERQADRDLYEALMRGEYCCVLTVRQMGKGSLMVRAATRLRQEGVAVAVLDLTPVGHIPSPEQWYDGLLLLLGQQLDLEDELEKFWMEHEHLAPARRWMAAIREVVLPRYPGRVVIFVDEIDAVRGLHFSPDEFFAAIRDGYEQREHDPVLKKLTFCLLGMSPPSDLIRDAHRTPFDIGTHIVLDDFTNADAAILAKAFGRGDRMGEALLQRVLFWTGGQPYLTQRLCHAVAEDPSVTGPHDVDRLCGEVFFSSQAQQQDANLLFVREWMLKSQGGANELLRLYGRIRSGEPVPHDETNPLISTLRLAGIIRAEGGCLRVRNRIYERVFNQRWVQGHLAHRSGTAQDAEGEHPPDPRVDTDG